MKCKLVFSSRARMFKRLPQTKNLRLTIIKMIQFSLEQEFNRLDLRLLLEKSVNMLTSFYIQITTLK